MEHAWLLGLLAALVMIAAVLGLFYWLGLRSMTATRSARERFQQRRSELEAAFFQAASTSGKPRGLRWKACQWSELIEWARDKQTGQLLALVGVTISFEAIEGGDMEGVEAVGNLRNATAVFFFDGDWRTAGRVVFNLNPAEVLEHFKGGYERVNFDGPAN